MPRQVRGNMKSASALTKAPARMPSESVAVRTGPLAGE